MATIERTEIAPSRERVAGYVLVGLVAVAALGVLIAYLGRPPQMGADEEVFRTVDALYTAVRAKDTQRLAECEARLHGHRDAGKLPASSAEFLDAVIAKARAGKWESATESLYEFMLAQRRDGADGHPAPKGKHTR
jgi:hypothetical protein